MTYLATCNACGKDAEGGGECKCGSLRVTATGEAYSRSYSDPDYYTREPNVAVREKKSPTPKKDTPTTRD